MSIELWLSFALACMAVLAVPGPTIMLVVSYALGRGRSTGWATVPGVVLGDFTAMTVSLLGAGAVLAASATLFTILKICGAAYLVWLGIRLWRSPATGPLDQAVAHGVPRGESGRAMFWNAYVVTALNPKGLVFFVAFVPQFLQPGVPVLQQFMIMEATFLVLAGLNAAAWAYAAGRLNSAFRSPALRRTVNRAGGAFLCGAGALTAVARQ